jgi:hypothetical protein
VSRTCTICTHATKPTEKQARHIRTCSEVGVPLWAIANRYGISVRRVQAIVEGKAKDGT